MILRGVASITVLAGLAGMLWSAPIEPVELVSLAAATPGEVEREASPEEAINQRINEFIEQVRQKMEALRADGRLDEAERLGEKARAHLAEVREIGAALRERKQEMQRLHAAGEIEEAQRAQHEAQKLLDELRRRIAPAGEGPPEPPMRAEMREHLEQLQHKIADLRADGRLDEARELQRKAREMAEQWRRGGVEPPRRPRPDDELGQMQMHLEKLHREIQHLHEEGHHAEADQLACKAEELQMEIHRCEAGREAQHAEQMEMQAHLEHLHQEIQHLHEQGHHEEAEELERHAHAMMMEVREREGYRQHPGADLEEMHRRIEHMLQAAENLDAAEMREQAEQLRRHAEMTEQRIREHMEGRPGGPDERLDILMDQMHELRAEVRELTELVRELHRRLDRFEHWD
jgi:hypothetical protein